MALQNVRTLQAQAAQRSASVALAEKKLGDTVIRAPFAGQVKERMVSPGQYVKVQTPAMVLVDNDPLRVRLKVPERMAGWVAVGQPVTVQVEAYPDRSFAGEDLAHQPVGRPAVARRSRSRPCSTTSDGALKPGFFARASIASSHEDETLVVPRTRCATSTASTRSTPSRRARSRRPRSSSARARATRSRSWTASRRASSVAVPLAGEELRDGARRWRAGGSRQRRPMTLAELCVRRGVFAVMLIAFLVVLGGFSFRELGVDLFPRADPATVNINVRLPGATPEEITTQVVLPLEEALSTDQRARRAELARPRRAARASRCQFVLEREIESAAQDVREKVAGALRDLPPNILPPDHPEGRSRRGPRAHARGGRRRAACARRPRSPTSGSSACWRRSTAWAR